MALGRCPAIAHEGTMPTTMAVDVDGTLIDTAAVMGEVRELVGTNASHLARTGREKQLEYPFRRHRCRSAEMRAAWGRRANDVVCDPGGIDGTITVSSLGELVGHSAGCRRSDGADAERTVVDIHNCECDHHLS